LQPRYFLQLVLTKRCTPPQSSLNRLLKKSFHLAS